MFREIFTRVRLVYCLLIVLYLPTGCSKSDEALEENSAKPAIEESVAPTDSNDEVASAEQAMWRMIEGLKNHQPQVVWQAMPEGFQRDLNGLVREFAGKMDPEFWNTAFATWKRLARLLAEKKSDILAHPEFADLNSEQRRRLEQSWDGLVELLTILVNSDLSDLKKLHSFEMGRFLEQTGGRWLGELAAFSESLGQDSLAGMLQGLEPIMLSHDGNTAVMAWTAAGDDEPISRFTMIKLEDRWIPAGWEAAWQRVREARAKLRQTPASALQGQSRDKLESLTEARQAIEALLETTTRDEFFQTLDRELSRETVREAAALIRLLAGPSGSADIAEAPSPPNVAKSNDSDSTARLLVKGAEGADDEDRIFEAIQAAVPGDVDVQFAKTSEGINVICGPVGDLDAFAKKLKFGSIERLDFASGTIHIRMNE